VKREKDVKEMSSRPPLYPESNNSNNNNNNNNNNNSNNRAVRFQDSFSESGTQRGQNDPSVSNAEEAVVQEGSPIRQDETVNQRLDRRLRMGGRGIRRVVSENEAPSQNNNEPRRRVTVTRRNNEVTQRTNQNQLQNQDHGRNHQNQNQERSMEFDDEENENDNDDEEVTEVTLEMVQSGYGTLATNYIMERFGNLINQLISSSICFYKWTFKAFDGNCLSP
jgi:hypothetical protein